MVLEKKSFLTYLLTLKGKILNQLIERRIRSFVTYKLKIGKENFMIENQQLLNLQNDIGKEFILYLYIDVGKGNSLTYKLTLERKI